MKKYIALIIGLFILTVPGISYSQRHVSDFNNKKPQRSGSTLIKNADLGLPLVAAPSGNKQLNFNEAFMKNQSGSDGIMGVAFTPDNSTWQFGQYVLADNPRADFVTFDADAKNITGGSAVPLFTTSIDEGFSIQSLKKINYICFAIAANTGDDGTLASPEYWNGSAFADFPVFEINLTDGSADFDTGVSACYLFYQPSDWVKGCGATDGCLSTHYMMRVMASGASSTGITADYVVPSQTIFIVTIPTVTLSAINPEFGFPLDKGEGLVGIGEFVYNLFYQVFND